MTAEEFRKLPGHERINFWSAMRRAGEEHFGEFANVYTMFRLQMEPFFQALSKGVCEFARRPPISLRLMLLGEPLAKLSVLPLWHQRRKSNIIDCSTTIGELLVEEKKTVSGRSVVRWRRVLDFTLPKDGRPRCGRLGLNGLHNLERIAGTIVAFVDDARGVLARNHDHCCICGRHLTDEVSRSRGIGPECIEKLDLLWVVDSPGLRTPVA
jgi:hypothetical protein